LELGKDEARDSILIKQYDLEKVRELATLRSHTLAELINDLAEYVKHRVDPEVATKALSKYLGHEVGSDYAVAYFTKVIAGWIIEAAVTLNIVRLRIR